MYEYLTEIAFWGLVIFLFLGASYATLVRGGGGGRGGHAARGGGGRAAI